MLHLLWLILTTPCFASTLQTDIAEIHLAPEASKPNLIFLMSDGIVAKLPTQDSKMLALLISGKKNHQFFELTLNDENVITDAKKIERPENYVNPFTGNFVGESRLENYTPTLLPDLAAASTIFKELNPYYRGRSECYNRAHVWVYEEYKKRNLNSMKVFMFFTSKYIWEYNYHWWFHVSPYVMVAENGGATEKVIDYAFMKGPTNMRDWTNFFIEPKTECPVVTKYSDYEKHQKESYCYLYKASMYFWQPMDIETLEQKGTEKTSFIPSEIDSAYWQAF